MEGSRDTQELNRPLSANWSHARFFGFLNRCIDDANWQIKRLRSLSHGLPS
jgi:hypothetical protein